MSFMDRAVQRVVSIFRDPPPVEISTDFRVSRTSSMLASKSAMRYDSTRSVLAPIQNRIAIDAAAIPIRHVEVDEFGQFISIKQSELNDRLTYMANLDQTGTAFIQDAVQTMLGEGVAALIPVEFRPAGDNSFEILSIRVGSISQWFNDSVIVKVYNDAIGDDQEIRLPKSFVAIAYNPMYPVMNDSNSTMTRLIDALALLDVADSRFYSPGLDLIVKLPYVVKSERKQEIASQRLDELEAQLQDRQYGIGYIDATEQVTQLNRPATNNLLDKVDKLTKQLHSQLGVPPTIFTGDASQEELVSYLNRTVLPVVTAITEAMVGTFFTRTAIRQHNSIRAMPSLFKMAPIETMAEAADKLTRNEIMSSNEVRAAFCLPKREEESADELRNKNLNRADNEPTSKAPEKELTIESTTNVKEQSNA